jgi:hypothetical protein
MHGWGDDPVAALPEVLRMAVGQVGIVPFDAERLKLSVSRRSGCPPDWETVLREFVI